MTKKSASELSLAQIEELLGKGDLGSVPDRVTVDLRSVKPSELASLLELIRYLPSGHRVDVDRDAQPMKERVRHAITVGDFARARELMRESRPALDPEIAIERARVAAFQGRYAEVIDLVSDVGSSAPRYLRGVASQLAGHAQLELGNLADAHSSLERALEISDSCGNALGSLAARLFLAKVAQLEKRDQGADRHLAESLRILRTEKAGYRWALGFLRTRSFVRFLRADPRCLSDAEVSARIASSLGDPLYEARARLEGCLYLKSVGQAKPSDLERARDVASVALARDGENDLAAWVRALEGDVGPDAPYSLRVLTMPLTDDRAPTWARPELPSTSAKLDWILDSETGLLVDLSASTYRVLSEDGPVAKLLEAFAGGARSIDEQDLFTSVWGLRWNPERHLNLLKVTLTRANRIGGSIRLRRSDSAVSIESSGWSLPRA